MATCANCNAELSPRWKFCIHCGTPITQARPEIPAAVRPVELTRAGADDDRSGFDDHHGFDDPEDESPSDRPSSGRRRLDVLTVLSVVLAIGGIALVVAMIVVLGGADQ